MEGMKWCVCECKPLWTHTCKLIERPHFLGISGIRVKIKSVPKYF